MIKLLSPADIITLINAKLGFLAILFLIYPIAIAIEIRIQISFCLILLAILADGLDGMVARKTRRGELGEFLEAMADMTSLGIAPAVFVYATYAPMQTGLSVLGILVILLVFLGCSIIRLSSFHIMKQTNYFVGLPASASTIFIIVCAFVGVPLLFMALLLVVVSVALLLPVRFLKPGLRLNAVAGVLILVTIVLRDLFSNITPLLLCAALLVYTLIGPFYLKKKHPVHL